MYSIRISYGFAARDPGLREPTAPAQIHSSG
jgi:hypothetical protein